MRGQNYDTETLGKLAAVLKTLPTSTKTTQKGTTTGTETTTQPDNSLWSLGGSLGGALLSPVEAGGTTALGSLAMLI